MGVSIRHLSKTFTTGGSTVRAVDDVSMDLEDGEFLVILGPSGSGKTTLLRCLAGLEQADEGEIAIDGRVVFSAKRKVWIPPERRGLSMVFQSYALWPHMTVNDNVAYPLRVGRPGGQRLGRKEVAARVDRMLALVGCGTLGRRYPGELSGGQQQRVAVARALVRGSRVVLFDEPLSSIDARIREELRKELVNLQAELGFLSVYITHDQTEATVMGHRVAVLSDGQLRQLAPPRQLYSEPNSSFVAQFTGAANQFVGELVVDAEGTARVSAALGDIAVASRGGHRSGDKVAAIVRPEQFGITREAGDRLPDNVWKGAVKRALFLGFCTEYLVLVNGVEVTVKAMDSGGEIFEAGDQVCLTVHPRHVYLVDA